MDIPITERQLAEAISKAIQTARDAALEEAAKVADSCVEGYDEMEAEAPLTSEDANAREEARNLAAAIRALMK